MSLKLGSALILATLLLCRPAIPASAAETNVARLCKVYERLMSLPSVQSRGYLATLFNEIEAICRGQYTPSVRESGISPPFPITIPSSRNPKQIPFCPDGSEPQNKTCGDAVPRSCTWYCWEGGRWELYPER